MKEALTSKNKQLSQRKEDFQVPGGGERFFKGVEPLSLSFFLAKKKEKHKIERRQKPQTET